MAIPVPVHPPAPQPTQHGYLSSYVSPFGYLQGLPERLDALSRALGAKPYLPFIGLGAARDLEIAVRLLNSREWLDHLRTYGDDDQSEHARSLLADLDTLEAADDAAAHVRNLPREPHALDPVATIEALDTAVDEARADYIQVRNVLVEYGALARDDKETSVADLLRALLS